MLKSRFSFKSNDHNFIASKEHRNKIVYQTQRLDSENETKNNGMKSRYEG